MSGLRRVYLDNNATTPVYPKAIEAILPYLRDNFGNPSSAHSQGRAARAKISEAREIVAGAMGASPSEIFFTSGGTESDNLAVKGYAWANRKHGGGHIITSTIEHPAVLEPCKYLSKNGYEVTRVPVDAEALVNPESVREAITESTILVSIMSANNEVGSIQPVAEIAKIAREKGVAMHTDAVQSFLKVPFTVDELGVDLLSVSGHKVNALKGVGALYIRKGTKMHALAHGGHHERGIRAGTENVAGIVSFGEAVRIGKAELEKTAAHVKILRDELERRILETIPFTKVNGHREKRTPGTLNMSFECVEGEALLINLDMAGISISTGSACSSGSLEPSHVLTSMGIPHEIVHGSLRFSFGHENTMDDVDYVMTHLPRIINTIREISPLWDPKNQKVLTLEEVSGGAKLGH
ncbi:MAG: cysteine desulfurase NifS [Nitrospinae bacterium]|nr:cysteine desulfurase NifS [Nitrospinota bacterium]